MFKKFYSVLYCVDSNFLFYLDWFVIFFIVNKKIVKKELGVLFMFFGSMNINMMWVFKVVSIVLIRIRFVEGEIGLLF